MQFLFELQGPQARADLWWPTHFFPFALLSIYPTAGRRRGRSRPITNGRKGGEGGKGADYAAGERSGTGTQVLIAEVRRREREKRPTDHSGGGEK